MSYMQVKTMSEIIFHVIDYLSLSQEVAIEQLKIPYIDRVLLILKNSDHIKNVYAFIILYYAFISKRARLRKKCS